MKFSKEYLMDELGLPCSNNEDIVLSNKIVDTGRWTIRYELVFKQPVTDKLYRTWYERGATEQQDQSPWEYDTEVYCEEVVAIVKEVVLYEKL